jgi:hypothetical protein
MAHPEFFSAKTLRRRLAERDLTESLANHLMASVWVPGSGADLRFLKDAVSSHLDRIEQIYSPIRDCHYGHRLAEVDAHAMFEKTNRGELGETLDVLRQLVAGLRFFYDNGVKPRVDVRGTKALDLQCKSYSNRENPRQSPFNYPHLGPAGVGVDGRDSVSSEVLFRGYCWALNCSHGSNRETGHFAGVL